MSRFLSVCVVLLGITGISQEVSTKLDFGEESSSVMPNASKEDEDVEVKHTIVVSTKVKNNNRRGLHSGDESSGSSYKAERDSDKNNDEVPIVKGYKSVETTQIRTPDTRIKPTIYPDYVAFNRNSRDEVDFYSNIPAVPMQWKPSTFFNNINWANPDSSFDNYIRRNRPDYQKFHRRVTDDGARAFYCNKCRELSGPKICDQQRRSPWIYETTTPRIKLDGKIAKLN